MTGAYQAAAATGQVAARPAQDDRSVHMVDSTGIKGSAAQGGENRPGDPSLCHYIGPDLRKRYTKRS